MRLNFRIFYFSTQYFVAEPDMLFNLPDKYSFEEGASLGIPFMTAYYNIVIQWVVTVLQQQNCPLFTT